jgi:ATP-dependent helicase/nuclease subunit B
VQTCFLLGPAGSGKTYRCLAEAQTALNKAPDGPSLILLAPKQATFQLERLLLTGPSVSGYTRLFILSFERLAHYVLAACDQPSPKLIDEQGRFMVLQAILGEQGRNLRCLSGLVRKPGFVSQLSLLLRELQSARVFPSKLRDILQSGKSNPVLDGKLHDLAIIQEAYREWLKRHRLQDADSLLEIASTTLAQADSPRQSGRSFPQVQSLWMDGFAQITEQELELLAALIPHCQRATIAFCIESEPMADPHWLSPWSTVSRTYLRVRHRLSVVPDLQMSVALLHRHPLKSRYATSPVLAHLEKDWAHPTPFPAGRTAEATSHDLVPWAEGLRVVMCRDPQSECRRAAEEILSYVRSGGRYHEVAILVRRLEPYQDSMGHELKRYGIPYFLDRREPVGQHPLAELTRSALRTLAFGWKHADWFNALKTGLVTENEDEIDGLENEALARGWTGEIWLKPFTQGSDDRGGNHWEALRRKIVPPFVQLARSLSTGAEGRAYHPTGPQLARALREFWQERGVDRRLLAWSKSVPGWSVHTAVWDQMNAWLDTLAMVFGDESMPLIDWLTVIEAGLASMTVGVLPPALDQVLVGSVDRSRNPELKLVILLGMNESVFPSPSDASLFLTEMERRELDQHGIRPLADCRQHLSHELYLGYIACTRSRKRLVLTCSVRSSAGEPLNPSPFLGRLQRLFPGLAVEPVTDATPGWKSPHVRDWIAPTLQLASAQKPLGPDEQAALDFATSHSMMGPILARWRDFQASLRQERLSSETVRAMYGNRLAASVSALEDYAACPFKFFVAAALLGRERIRFETDSRRCGSLVHALLREFHRQLEREGLRWRDVTPDDARARVSRLGRELTQTYAHGLFQQQAQARFMGNALGLRVEQLVEAMVRWSRQNAFDPVAVELSFGLKNSPLPEWKLDLGQGRELAIRGMIDRVDLWRDASADYVYLAVYDYKSRARPLDPVLMRNGIEIQLPAYLAALSHSSQARDLWHVRRLVLAGAFYIGVRPQSAHVENRSKAIIPATSSRSIPFQHLGRFRAEALRTFDARTEAQRGDQYRYSLNKDGRLSRRGNDAMPSDAFDALLDQVQEQMIHLGREILDGRIQAEPFRRSQQRACDFCVYQSICRFDPWTQPYRVLSVSAEETNPTPSPST